MNRFIAVKKDANVAALDNSGGYKAGSYLHDNRPQSTIQHKLMEGISNIQTVQKKANSTGLPDNLKSGIESLSGYSMNDVKVHYNSSNPAQLNAHAYAQGTDIHVARGQEKHLPHEAWHVVQQKQGRVRPTLQMKGKVNINDDKGLEKEADVMGAKAMQLKSETSRTNNFTRTAQLIPINTEESIIQRVLRFSAPPGNNEGQVLLTAAYAVGAHGHHQSVLNFVADGLDSYGQAQFRVTETQRPGPQNDGLGSHLIGKIIDDGDVHIYFGEQQANDARPRNAEESAAGRRSAGDILLSGGASAIQLIHELIHTYHFDFDAWNTDQKAQVVTVEGGRTETAEEASTVGLGQWAHFGLTENAFRDQMGLPRRDRYTGWVEP